MKVLIIVKNKKGMLPNLERQVNIGNKYFTISL